MVYELRVELIFVRVVHVLLRHIGDLCGELVVIDEIIELLVGER